MTTKNLKVYYFPNSFSAPKGILILARNKKEAQLYIKQINSFNCNYQITKSEVIEKYSINHIEVIMRDEYYFITDVVFSINKDNDKKYLSIEKYNYAQNQEKTEKELIKLFLNNLKVKEFNYDY